VFSGSITRGFIVWRYAKYFILLLPVLLMIVIVTAQDNPRCAGFQRLSGGRQTISTYGWSAVADIQEYKVNFYDSAGQFVTSYWVLPPKTTLDVNLGDLPTGAYFQWEVEALENGGAKVCNTGRSNFAMLPNDRQPGGTVDASITTQATPPESPVIIVPTPTPEPI
jgi:hypothetical protein